MRVKSFFSAYRRTRGMAKRHKTRADFDAWQREQLQRHMQEVLPRFSAFNGCRPRDLRDLPRMDKQALLENFAGYNAYGIGLNDTRAASDRGRPLLVNGRPLHAGSSTGTSGNKGYYLIDEAERYAWLGAALGKMLPNFWFGRHRIAVVLPRNTPLYTGANRALGVTLEFFGTDLPPGILSRDVRSFCPDILIAAPRVARLIGDLEPDIRPRRVILGSEVADPGDLKALKSRFDRVEQIYMATEGLLATTCKHGSLHLCEDLMHFELAHAGDGLVTPIITDFSRHSQAMVRYQMNDLLDLGRPCRCGSPLQVVKQVIGRCDDSFLVTSPNGQMEQITPDRLRDCIISAHPSISEFRLEQTSHDSCVLSLEGSALQHAEAVQCGLERLFAAAGTQMHIETRSLSRADIFGQRAGPQKLRRIRRSM